MTANVSAREEEQEPAVEVQEAAHMPAETSRTASSEEALVGKDGQEAIVAKRRSRGSLLQKWLLLIVDFLSP